MECRNRSHGDTLPEVLGIDECKGNAGGEKYQCILTDIEKRYIVDILPDRRKYRIMKYLREETEEERRKVKFSVRDMRADYRALACLSPNAQVIADKYHWVRQVSRAPDRVRKKARKEFSDDRRLRFKRNKWILTTGYSNLNTDDRLVLQTMLNQSTDLYNAWILKEMVYKFVDCTTVEDAREQLISFFLYAEKLGMEEFKDCIKACHNWSTEILHSIQFVYTNAFTKGMNNSSNVLKRIACGCRNQIHFRARILSLYGKKPA